MNARLPLLVLALASAAEAQAPQEELRAAVALEVRPLGAEAKDAIDPLELESRVILRLIQEGFAVVAPFAGPDILLEVGSTATELKLYARDVLGSASAAIPLSSGSRAELQLEVSQRLVALARSRAAALADAFRRAREAAISQGQEPLPPTPGDRLTQALDRERRRAIVPDVPPAPPPADVRFRPDVGVDALWRGSAVDPLFRVGASLGSSRVRAAAAAGFSPSGAEGLTVREWQIQAGPWARLWSAGPVSADASLLAGVVAHTYSFAGFEASEPQGTKLDVLITLPIQVTWQAAGWFGVGARVAPGVATSVDQVAQPESGGHVVTVLRGGRDHLRDGASIWHREAARLEAGFTLSGTF